MNNNKRTMNIRITLKGAKESNNNEGQEKVNEKVTMNG